MLSYSAAVREIEALGVMPDRPPALDSVREGLRRLNYTHGKFYREIFLRDPARVIVVAGTNGKGSVCAMLEALFRARGERVGLYTSPHLVQTTERFRVAGQDISPEEFTRVYQHTKSELAGLRVTHFEMLTLMAVVHFAQLHPDSGVDPSGRSIGDPSGDPMVDRMILEVGLGGTWDATNAIPHGVCLVTALGLDHQNLLGHDLSQIAANKFGIVPTRAELGGVPAQVFYAPFPVDEEERLEAQRAECEARTGSFWTCATAMPYAARTAESAGGEPTFSLRWCERELPLPLPGARAAQNASLALTCFEKLCGSDLPAEFDLARALAHTRWPGRMQRVEVRGAPCPVYLSGDHNLAGIQSVRELLAYYRFARLRIVFGASDDKDFGAMLDTLLRGLHRPQLVLTEASFKARRLNDFGEWRKLADAAIAEPAQALRFAVDQATADDLILVTGSLYLVGDILARLQGAPSDHIDGDPPDRLQGAPSDHIDGDPPDRLPE